MVKKQIENIMLTMILFALSVPGEHGGRS